MTHQLEIGDLVTREDIRLSVERQQRKRRAKETRVDFEQLFADDCKRYRLPNFVRKFPLEKTDQQSDRVGKGSNRILQWEFDFCFPDYKLFVEIDGGIWSMGAHGHPIDIVRNMRKRNDAAHAGYLVLSFATDHVKHGDKPALVFLMRFFLARGWRHES